LSSSDTKPQHSPTLQTFNDALQRAGWQVNDFTEMFQAGISVNPEGIAVLEKDAAVLEAHLSLPDKELRLFILERETDKLIRLVVAFEDNLGALLSNLIDEQDGLNASTFPRFLHRASKLTERIWFVDHDGRRFPLEFPNASDPASTADG
jgi:hypothetical protein